MSKPVTVIFIAEERQYVAQCIEYDICAQGATVEKAEAAFIATAEGQALLDRTSGWAMFEGIPPAPIYYHHCPRVAGRGYVVRGPAP